MSIIGRGRVEQYLKFYDKLKEVQIYIYKNIIIARGLALFYLLYHRLLLFVFVYM